MGRPRWRSRSCIIDGEAVACDDNGVASFNLIRYRRHDNSTFLYAFDLIELNGDDLRHDPLEVRKATLASIVAKAGSGIRFNEHMEGDGPTVFAHACKLGLEGIVSNSAYRSGRSPDWLRGAKKRKTGANRNGDKLSLPFRLPHRCVGCRRRECHRAPGRRRGPAGCDGNVPGRMSTMARDANHTAPRHTSN
jgi:ATP dependent DNA ligase domain